MATILIAGCGSIGIQLGETLSQQGHEVLGLRRSQAALPFRRITADLSQPLPSNLLPPLDYVVYTATPDERSDVAYQRAYPQGVKNLLSALGTSPLKRFIFVSSTAVYHQDDGTWVDEASPTLPIKFNGQRVLEAETLLQQSTQSASTVVRFGGIYGPNRNALIRRVKRGATVQTQPPKYTNRIHQDDCVGVLQFIIQQTEQDRPLEDCYLAVDSDPADEATVCTWLAQQLDASPPVPASASVLTSAPTSASASQNKRCCNQRLLTAGYAFQYPSFREGYAKIIASAF